MFTLGSDPEFAITRQHKLCSAIGVVPGDREHRHVIGNHQFFYDNVLAECAIAPGASRDEVISNVRECLQAYAKLIHPYRLFIKASCTFPASELTHPEAKKVNCSEEICVYSMRGCKLPENIFEKTRQRCCGGHIHLGGDVPENTFSGIFVVRMLDLFLSIPSIFIEKDTTEKNRRKLYGKAGRFRMPAHGIEYRTPSNFWLTSPALCGLVYDICKFTVDFVGEERYLDFWSANKEELAESKWAEEVKVNETHKCTGYDVAALCDAINSCSREKAQPFLELIKNIMPAELFQDITDLFTEPQQELYQSWGLC